MEANPSPSQEFGFAFPLLLGHASIIHLTFISTDDSVFKLNAHQKLVTVLNFFRGPVPLNPGVRLEPARSRGGRRREGRGAAQPQNAAGHFFTFNSKSMFSLSNLGFGDREELEKRIQCWQVL